MSLFDVIANALPQAQVAQLTIGPRLRVVAASGALVLAASVSVRFPISAAFVNDANGLGIEPNEAIIIERWVGSFILTSGAALSGSATIQGFAAFIQNAGGANVISAGQPLFTTLTLSAPAGTVTSVASFVVENAPIIFFQDLQNFALLQGVATTQPFSFSALAVVLNGTNAATGALNMQISYRRIQGVYES